MISLNLGIDISGASTTVATVRAGRAVIVADERASRLDDGKVAAVSADTVDSFTNQSRALKRAVGSAARALGSTPGGAVVTVPARYGEAQRGAMRAAAERAGVDLVGVVSKPVAAALAYKRMRAEDRCIGVFDWEEDGVEVTLLERVGNAYRALAASGDSALGAGRVDARVLDRIVAHYSERTGVDARRDSDLLARFARAAEDVRRELGTRETAQVTLGRTVDRVVFTMTREELAEAVAPLVERTRLVVDKALARASLQVERIDAVILVGELARLPTVAAAVARFVNKAPLQRVPPEHVVALGAAVQAHALSRAKKRPRSKSSVASDTTEPSLHFSMLPPGDVAPPYDEVAPGRTPTSGRPSFFPEEARPPEPGVSVIFHRSELADDGSISVAFKLDDVRRADSALAPVRRAPSSPPGTFFSYVGPPPTNALATRSASSPNGSPSSMPPLARGGLWAQPPGDTESWMQIPSVQPLRPFPVLGVGQAQRLGVSLCVALDDGRSDILFVRGTEVPCSVTRTIATAPRRTVTVRVAEGDAPRFADNGALGELVVEATSDAGRGAVLATFSVGADGTLEVSARAGGGAPQVTARFFRVGRASREA